MLTFGLAIALAQDDLVAWDAWVEAGPVAVAAGGVLDLDRGWVRTASGCLPATIDRGASPQLVIPLCEQRHGDVTVRCDQTTALGLEWWEGGTRCSWTGPDGVGGGWGSAHGSSHHGPPRLVALDADRAEWRRVVRIAAEFERNATEVHPCTPESLVALGDAAPEDGRRRCDVSSGLRWYVVPVGYGRGIGVGGAIRPEPVDCREPCPPHPDAARVEAENARLADRWFAHRDGEVAALYRTKRACLAATGGAPVVLEPPACDPVERPWEAATPRR